MKSIQNKILVVVISGLLVITAVVSMIAVNMTHEVMHTDADRILNNVTLKEAAYINDVLGDITKSAAIMEHYAIENIDDPSQLGDKDFREKYIEKTKKMFSEISFNTSGVAGFFLRLNPEFAKDYKSGYYNLINDDKTIREMPVTDLSKYPANDTKNVGWYYTAVQKGEATWLDPYFFPGYELKLISYTVPIYVDSKLIGVIGFDMDFGYLVEKIDSISVYENGYAVLLSADGKTAYNEVKSTNGTNPHTKATATLLNGMCLELCADYKDIQKNIHPMLSKIVIAFLVVLAVSILYTIVVTHRIVRPLKQLTKVAEEVSLGNGDTAISKIPVGSKDEIGTLSRVFKNTYEKISEYTAYINALAYRDSLTGIKNSTAYSEAISEINKEINFGNPRFGVIVADINNLKHTNDKYGHDVGNDLIVHAAKILADIFKTSAVFRIGGDEFAVILKDYDFNNYYNLMSTLDEVCSKEYIVANETDIQLSLARGVAIFNPNIDKVYEDVFIKADHAMYLHKEQSKMATV